MPWKPLEKQWLARRSDLVQASASLLERARRSGALTTPLVLALKAANRLAASLAKQPGAALTHEQRRALNAAAAQIRLLAARTIISADAHVPNTVEFELAELIRRTLALVERVAKEPETIETTLAHEEFKLEKPRE